MMACMLKNPQRVIILKVYLDWGGVWATIWRSDKMRFIFFSNFYICIWAYNPLTGEFLYHIFIERDFIYTYLGNRNNHQKA